MRSHVSNHRFILYSQLTPNDTRQDKRLRYLLHEEGRFSVVVGEQIQQLRSEPRILSQQRSYHATTREDLPIRSIIIRQGHSPRNSTLRDFYAIGKVPNLWSFGCLCRLRWDRGGCGSGASSSSGRLCCGCCGRLCCGCCGSASLSYS